MTDLPKTQPEFTAAIRGYDRVQVDEYVERLHLLLGDAEERVRAAEDDLEFSRHATVGPRVSQIFDLAVAESQELRERVQGETESMQAEARENAERIRIAAREDDKAIRARTEQEHEEMLDELDRQREAAQQQLAVLQTRRTELMNDLKRLHGALGAAAGILTDADTQELVAVGEDQDTALHELIRDGEDASDQPEEDAPPEAESATG